MRKSRRNKGCIVMATVLLAALLGGCSFLSKEADATEVSSKAETESPGATQESETETAETEETQESHEAAEDEESGEEETEDHFVEKKIVVATDMPYFAEKLAGNRCDSFVGMARGGDGRVLEYGWEVMDAFLDDMKKEDPDLLILSGDLTLDGEKASHEELAELLDSARRELRSRLYRETTISITRMPAAIRRMERKRWSPSQRTSSGISMRILAM